MGMKVTLKWIMKNIQVVQTQSRMSKYVLYHHSAWDSLSRLSESRKTQCFLRWGEVGLHITLERVPCGGSSSSGLCSLKLLWLYYRHTDAAFQEKESASHLGSQANEKDGVRTGSFSTTHLTHRHAPHLKDLPRKCYVLTYFIPFERWKRTKVKEASYFLLFTVSCSRLPRGPWRSLPKSAVTLDSWNRPPPDRAVIILHPGAVWSSIVSSLKQ